MQIRPLRPDLNRKLVRYGLVKKFTKVKSLFECNPRHPSLHTELLYPHKQRIYSFRIDRKYRASFITIKDEAEVIAITVHYQ